MASPGPHLVLFPFMAQGHIIPFLALAKYVQQRYPHYTITLVNPPLNIRSLRPSVPPNSKIRLRELPFSSSDHGLPPDSENTDCIPYHLIVRLMHASSTLQPHFETLVSDITREDGRPPICIIADCFLGWTTDVAKKLGVFHANFSTCGGYGMAAYLSLWLNLPHLRTGSDEFWVPGFPDNFRLHRSQLSKNLREADGTDPWSVFLKKQLSLCLASDGMLCNTAQELEIKGVELLGKNTGLLIWTIGPLLPRQDADSSSKRSGKKSDISPAACLEWLEQHPPLSVLFISFGSQNTISASQMMQLAKGLEASGKAFIWVVRPPIGFDLNEDFRDEWLPEGFESRIKESGRGIVVRKWGPQLEILSHGSTGAFLSHCGWNSVLESLSRGVPIIGWPLSGEQFYNSKMMEDELGVCVELARGVEDEIKSEEVERVIRMVMGEEQGMEMKRKAVEAADNIRAAISEEGNEKGSSIKALDNFISTILAEKKARSAHNEDGGENISTETN